MEHVDLVRACRRLLERFKSLPPGRICMPLLPLGDDGGHVAANPGHQPAAAARATSRELVAAFHVVACAAGGVAIEVREVLGLPPDDSSNGLDGRWIALVFEAARAEVAPPPCRISRAPYPQLLTMAQAAEVARTMGIVAEHQADAEVEPPEMLADAVEASIALVELAVERVERIESRSVAEAVRPVVVKKPPRRPGRLGGGKVGRPSASAEEWMRRAAKLVRERALQGDERSSETYATAEMHRFCGLVFDRMLAAMQKLFPNQTHKLPSESSIRFSKLYREDWKPFRNVAKVPTPRGRRTSRGKLVRPGRGAGEARRRRHASEAAAERRQARISADADAFLASHGIEVDPDGGHQSRDS